MIIIERGGFFMNEITEFDAKGTVTKAQAATMLVRILALTEVE